MLVDKKSLRGCPVCEASDCEILHTQRFVLPEGHPLAEGYDVVCCHTCGFVFADTPVSQQDYDAFYRKCSKYQDDKTSTGGGDSPLDLLRLREQAACIAEVVTDRDARILDVGCANGGLLHSLKEIGYHNLTGIDPSPVCAKKTRRVAGVRTEAGTLSELPVDFGPFDCIILSHVLEHVQDLGESIRAVRGLLADGGRVYLEVPDASRYAGYLAAPFQDFNTEHINHFSLTCLVNLATRVGLTPVGDGAKVIEGPHPVPYPAVYAFFRSNPSQDPPFAMTRETALRDRILEYVQLSRQQMRAIDERLQAAVAQSPGLIVWGTGQLALKLLAETALSRARIAAFVDGNPVNHGRRLHGQRIIAPREVATLPHPIVITSILHESEIVQEIRDRLGLPNPLITLADLTLTAESV
jgi:hypothetical protein